jgi:hypothetical protein
MVLRKTRKKRQNAHKMNEKCRLSCNFSEIDRIDRGSSMSFGVPGHLEFGSSRNKITK